MYRSPLGLLLCVCVACGNSPGGPGAANNGPDGDGDGVGEALDCDDANPDVYPGAPELCNGVDDNCDGLVDEGVLPTWHPDADGDGYGDPSQSAGGCEPIEGWVDQGGDCDDTDPAINPGAAEYPCTGIDEDCSPQTADAYDGDGDGWFCPTDCHDANPDIYPGAPEICDDGIDSDCDGLDGGTDNDGDGWSTCQGDCDDTNWAVNPAAAEVIGDGVDNDCDGSIDLPSNAPCGSQTIAAAMEVPQAQLQSQGLSTTETAPGNSYGVLAGTAAGWGNSSLDPRAGCEMGVLTSGQIWDTGPNPGYSISGGCGSHSDPNPAGGNGVTICDLLRYSITLQAPSNAEGFSFDFVFLSSEYPEWINSGFNDTFYAILEAGSTNGGVATNISVDPLGRSIEVDNSFFEQPGYGIPLSGTQYSSDAGSTGWLRTTWPISANELFTITFTIHDEGDAIFDSMVLLDNWQWYGTPVTGGTDHQ